MYLILKANFFIKYLCILCACYTCVLAQKDDASPSQPTTTTINRECNKNTLKRVDELLAKVTTYGNSGRKFPENTEQLPKYCKYAKNIYNFI